MCLTLLQPRVKQSGAPVFKQPVVPPGLLIHFNHCVCVYVCMYVCVTCDSYIHCSAVHRARRNPGHPETDGCFRTDGAVPGRRRPTGITSLRFVQPPSLDLARSVHVLRIFVSHSRLFPLISLTGNGTIRGLVNSRTAK